MADVASPRHLFRTWLPCAGACVLLVAGCGDARRDRPAPASALSMSEAPPPATIAPVWTLLRGADKLQGDYWPVHGRDRGSPDGRWLARTYAGELQVLDANDARLAAVRLPPELVAPQIVSWSPDGRWLVVTDQSTARLTASAFAALIEWRAEERRLTARLLRFDDLPEKPNRFSLQFNGNDRLLLVARGGAGPQLRPAGKGEFLGEARVFDLPGGNVVMTSTAAQAGNLMFGEVMIGIDVTETGRRAYAEVRGKRGALPLPESATLVILGGHPAGDWLLVSGLEPTARTSALIAFNRLTGALLKLAEVGSYSAVVAAPELGMTALQINTLAGETRLLLIDWRDAAHPRTIDAGVIVQLSGYDAAEQRLVAVIKDAEGESELAAFEP